MNVSGGGMVRLFDPDVPMPHQSKVFCEEVSRKPSQTTHQHNRYNNEPC